MTERTPIRGLLAPVVTPFRRDLTVDPVRYLGHCRWLLSQGSGLAVFGTNSEANSLTVEERMELLEGLVAAGLDPQRMMPGTGCCALFDSIRLTAHATKLGVAGVLMLPPFYYKGVSDEGLFRSYAEVIERVGDARLRIYLYHIPPVAQVPLGLKLIQRLLQRYPDTIVGIKDSSGDWSNTKAMLDAFPGFEVFAGSEEFLLANMRAGGVGCISATANINPAAIHRLYEGWRSTYADAAQAALSETRRTVQKYPMIPALKAVIAHHAGDPDWSVVRPPLVALPQEQQAALNAALKTIGFAMPGLEPAMA